MPGLCPVGRERGGGVSGRGARYGGSADPARLGHADRHPAVFERPGGIVPFVLEQQLIEPGPLRESGTAEQRSVPFGMGHGVWSPARQDQLSIAPDTREIDIHPQVPALVEECAKLGCSESWSIVADLEEAATIAAHSGIQLAHAGPAGRALLPGGHVPGSVPCSTRAPSTLIRSTRVEQATPAFRYASAMAWATRAA